MPVTLAVKVNDVPGSAGVLPLVSASVVVVEGIWPNHRFDNGIGINSLTSAEPGWPNGGAVFHDTAVWCLKDALEAAFKAGVELGASSPKATEAEIAKD